MQVAARHLMAVIVALMIGTMVGLADAYVPDDLDFPTFEPSQPSQRSEPSERTQPFVNSLGMKFVHIPPGTFTMGSPPNENGRDLHETQHQVTLTKGFYMGVTEVTQGQWKGVMGNNPSHFKDCGDDCPVESVSWNDCQEFIRRLNQKEGMNKYRLPTEAEWEYACRAGSTGAYAGDLDSMAWYDRNSGGKTHPVGQKKPNAWGLHDMHGNVSEWCEDLDFLDSVIHPKGPSAGSVRVDRGGGWCFGAGGCRSAYRGGVPAGGRYFSLGFRLAHPVK